jgi:hypothetical protein
MCHMNRIPEVPLRSTPGYARLAAPRQCRAQRNYGNTPPGADSRNGDAVSCGALAIRVPSDLCLKSLARLSVGQADHEYVAPEPDNPATLHPLRTAHYPPLTTHCPLLTAHRPLSPAHYPRRCCAPFSSPPSAFLSSIGAGQKPLVCNKSIDATRVFATLYGMDN